MTSSSDRKPGRLARHWRTAREIQRDPGSIPARLRSFLLELWCARGAGFYGLGYVFAFVFFEVRMLLGDVLESDGASDFVLGQLLEYLLRLTFLSFVNVFLALLWPLLLASLWDGLGLALLLVAYLAFERVLKPGVEARFPELKAYRERRAAERRAAQEARKARRRAWRDWFRKRNDNEGHVE